MPRVPTVSAPITGPSPEGVRANPNMFAGVGEAGARLGNAVANIGDHFIDYASQQKQLAVKVKSATDSAYVIGANAKLEAANQEFRNWTATNPDTSTWDSEYDARMLEVKSDVLDGGKNLNPLVREHLTATTNAFQLRSKADVNHLKTQQNIKNGQGILEEAVNQATSVGDAVGAQAAIDSGVSSGLLHPKMAAAMSNRVRVGIATNQVKSAIEQDPFTVREAIEAKNEDGTYKNFDGLPVAARLSAIATANRLAAQTRAETQKNWRQSVYEAQNMNGPMPDRDAIEAEAKHQGISPQWVEKLFKPAEAFNPTEFAQDLTRINALHLTNDDDGKLFERQAEAVAIATKYKGFAAEQLQKLINHKGPDGAERAVEKNIFSRMEEDRKQNGLTLPMAEKTVKNWFSPDVTTPERFDGSLEDVRKLTPEYVKRHFGKDATKEQVLAAEAQQYAGIVTKMREWFADPINEKATEEQAEKYRQSLFMPHTMEKVQGALNAGMSKFEAGKIYKDAKGNRAKWDGKGFVAP